MNWEQIVGQENLKTLLRDSIANNRVSHAQLFIGKKGYGTLPLAMAFAKEISDRIIFMDKGVIIEDASPDEVFSSDNERTREFLGKYHDVN